MLIFLAWQHPLSILKMPGYTLFKEQTEQDFFSPFPLPAINANQTMGLWVTFPGPNADHVKSAIVNVYELVPEAYR